MDYKQKIKYAEVAAEDLKGEKTLDQIKTELKEKGLYERDIIEVVVSARNILAEHYSPIIGALILENKNIYEDPDCALLDRETLDTIIEKENQKLSLKERKKINNLLKNGIDPNEIIKQVDGRFLSIESAIKQISKNKEVKDQNSGLGRTANIAGGLGLIFLSVVLLFTADRLFYFLPIIGIIMIVKGLSTNKMSYDD